VAASFAGQVLRVAAKDLPDAYEASRGR